MSVVLLYHGHYISAIASDSRVKPERGTHTDSVKKTFDIRGGLLGVCGVSGLITATRKAIWEEPNPALTEWPKGEYQALYLTDKGKLYEIDGGQITPHESVTVMGIGVGGDVALGAAEAWFRLNKIRKRNKLQPERAESMLRFAISCAIAHHSDCGGRIWLRVCDLREL